MPRLIRPGAALHDAFLAAHREWGRGLHEDGFGIEPDDDVTTSTGFAAWIADVDARPVTSWWIVEDMPVGATVEDAPRILGAIALRPTDVSGDLITGHIGYGVTPSARGRGVATWALIAVLSEAARRGLPACTLVCLDDNVASIRTIERCGGRLATTTTDGHGVRRRVYRIILPALGPDGASPDGGIS